MNDEGICCFGGRFDIKDYITGFGSPQWKKTHEAAEKTAVVVTTLLRNGATCVAKTIMDEMGFGYIFSPIFPASFK